MADYTPDPKNTADTFTAAEWTEATNEIEEQENQLAAQDTQINAKQPSDADLTALAAASADGYWKRESGLWVSKSAIPKTDLASSVQTSLDAADTASYWPVEKLTTGFCVINRTMAVASIAMVSGRIHLDYFTAPETASRTSMLKVGGATPAAPTPTMIKFGVYSVAANGDLTLIASTPNDTSLFTVAFQTVTKAFSVACPFTRGNRYATAILVISAATMPSLWGGSGLSGGEVTQAPRFHGAVTGQTDLPATITSASVSVGAPALSYARLS